jgi:hypothetical protein
MQKIILIFRIIFFWRIKIDFININAGMEIFDIKIKNVEIDIQYLILIRNKKYLNFLKIMKNVFFKKKFR